MRSLLTNKIPVWLAILFVLADFVGQRICLHNYKTAVQKQCQEFVTDSYYDGMEDALDTCQQIVNKAISDKDTLREIVFERPYQDTFVYYLRSKK